MELALAQQLASEVKDLLYSSSGKIEIAGGNVLNGRMVQEMPLE